MQSSNRFFKRVKPGLGTLIEISVETQEENAQDSISSTFLEIARLEKIFNFFDPDSDLSKMNRGEMIELPSELKEVVLFASDLKNLSSNRFNPETSRGLDLGGISKGFIVDQAALFLKEKLPDAQVMVNAGGDIRNLSQDPTTIELRIPSENDEARKTMELQPGLAVATSSLNAQSLCIGTPSAHYTSINTSIHRVTTATVVANNCMTADAFTKIVLFSNNTEELSALPLSSYGVKQIFAFSKDGHSVVEWANR